MEQTKEIIAEIREKATNSPKPMLVAVAGISGCGKSVLCKQLQQELSASILYLDGYNYNKKKRNMKNITGAHPDCFDSKQAEEDLKKIKRGEPVQIPLEPIERKEFTKLEAEKIIFIDGQTALFLPEDLYDYIIFVECPKNILWKRKQKQGDTRELFELRYKQFLQYIEPQKKGADRVIPFKNRNL